MLSINHLTKLKPHERLAYVSEHLKEFESLTQRQRDRIGTLLCHASPEAVRAEFPIVADYKADPAQEYFEKQLHEGHSPLEARDRTLRKFPNAKL